MDDDSASDFSGLAPQLVRRGALVWDFTPVTLLIPFERMGCYRFAFTETVSFVSERMPFAWALEAAEQYASAAGYLFIRIVGPEPDAPDADAP
jgi:hypothetical protein